MRSRCKQLLAGIFALIFFLIPCSVNAAAFEDELLCEHAAVYNAELDLFVYEKNAAASISARSVPPPESRRFLPTPSTPLRGT